MIKSDWSGDFPGGPMVKNLSFQSRGHRFDPSLEKTLMLGKIEG